MAIPQADVARVRRWCLDRVPEYARDVLRVECVVGDQDLTLVERHAPLPIEGGPVWSSEPVARLRYSAPFERWTLFFADRRHGFQRYPWCAPSANVGHLLIELDKDPALLFWAS